MQELLRNILYGEYDQEKIMDLVDRVQTFEEVGILGGNQGLVVRLEDGSEYQITFYQTK